MRGQGVEMTELESEVEDPLGLILFPNTNNRTENKNLKIIKRYVYPKVSS